MMRVSLPPTTRLLLLVCLILSSVYQFSRFCSRRPVRGIDDAPATGFLPFLDQRYALSSETLALVPQLSVFYPWTYVTATFTEQNVVSLLVATLTITLAGRYFERAWGSLAFARFVLVVTLVPNVLAVLVYVLWFAIFRDPERA